MTLDTGKYTAPRLLSSALVTIDTQNDFTLDNAPAQIPGTAEVVPNMTRLLESYRKAGRPVIHVVRLYLQDGSNVDACRRHLVEDGETMVAPGSDGAELVDALKPNDLTRLDAELLLAGQVQQIGSNEFVIYKPRWGAFYGTRLEAFLIDLEVDTLVFCGCNYPNCPRTSVYEASERDFRVVLVTDALSQLYAKGEDELRNIGVRLMETAEIERLLADPASSQ